MGDDRAVAGAAMQSDVADGVTFDASADSIAQARRLVVAQLESWDLVELADDACLVVSELLTNAVLHARPPVRMRFARIAEGVRVEVSDGSPELPLLVRAGTDVMTGRGWNLVEALSDDWGVVPNGAGKVVWAILRVESPAELGKQLRQPSAASLDPSDPFTTAADLHSLPDPRHPESAEDRYEVTLGDVPTNLLMAAKAHIDAVIREFALLASGASGGESRVPSQLAELIERVVGNFSEARQSIKRQALRAAEQHAPRTQLSLYLPFSAADAGVAYLAALDEVDAYCRAEQMLTLETPPAHRVFRCWYVEELVYGLRRAAHPEEREQLPAPESFESRLLREFDRISKALESATA